AHSPHRYTLFPYTTLFRSYQERFDNYSDFGSTEKPKFFFRWQPIDSSLTFRGTYSEAYHAPALAELYTSQGQILVPVNDPATVRSEEHTSELQSPCNLVCR